MSAAAVPFLLAASTAVSVYSQVQAGKAAQRAGDFNAAVGEQNVELSKRESTSEEKRQRVLAFKAIGRIRASNAASGTGVEGSVLDVLAESINNSTLDSINILESGRLNASGFSNSASLDRAAGRNARRAGQFNAASTALLGGAQTYTQYLKQI